MVFKAPKSPWIPKLYQTRNPYCVLPIFWLSAVCVLGMAATHLQEETAAAVETPGVIDSFHTNCSAVKLCKAQEGWLQNRNQLRKCANHALYKMAHSVTKTGKHSSQIGVVFIPHHFLIIFLLS
jgi:hypothetical protein